MYCLYIIAISLCKPNPCFNKGKCTDVGDAKFECNCTGTLHEGVTCETPTVLIDDIGVLQVNGAKQITIHAPLTTTTSFQASTGCGFDNVLGPSDFYIYPCSINFPTSNSFTIYGLDPGAYSVKFTTTGLALDIPALSFVVSSGDTSKYFDAFGDSSVIKSSCCKPSFSNLLLKCSDRFVQLRSSCSWKRLPGNFISTQGMVFTIYDSIEIPLSLAGVTISTAGTLTTTLPNIDRDASCGKCKPMLKPLSSKDTCYEHIPKPADLQAFVEKQSLTATFLSAIRRQLFPEWFNILIAEDNMAINRLNDRDYIANIMDKTALLLEPGCESLVVDETNHLIVLQHNGPLTLKVEDEVTTLSSPIGQLSYYCIAVSLCSGDKSVYIGIPPPAQTDLAKISFISNYINKGWKFEFLSATLSQEDRTVQFDVKYWNGLLYSKHNHSLNINYDTVLNMSVSGGFLYETTAADFEFNGQVWYKYVTNNATVHIHRLDANILFIVITG